MIVKKRLISIYLHIKATFEARLAFLDQERPPVLVYQMGKVGSSTVYNSLLDMGLKNSIHHVHFLSVDLPEYRRRHELAGIFPAPYHIFLGEALSKVIAKRRGFPIKIISLVRDPVALVVSALFENTYFNKELLENDSDVIDPQKAIDQLELYFQVPDNCRYIYDWFDREFKHVFGIDVFATPFPVEKGYEVYSYNNVEALVIRLEDLAEKGPKSIAAFLGLDAPLSLQLKNIRTEIKLSDSYQKVLNGICLDKDLCGEIYSSRFVKHFYTDEMIEKFITKWSRSDSTGDA